MKVLLFALLLMGFTSLVVQTLLIREFLIVFLGNELTIGLILSNWIVLEALGASIFSPLAQRSKRPIIFYITLQVLISAYFPASIILVRSIKDILGAGAGEGLGIVPVFISSLFLLLPLSLCDGAQFPFGCRMLSDISKRKWESPGKVYILEAMGFIVAGPLFTYLFITHLNSLEIAFIIGLLNILSSLLLIKMARQGFLKKCYTLILFLLLALSLGALSLNFSERLQRLSVSRQFKGQEVLDYRNSIYGNLTVTKMGDQLNFFSDGIPIITTPHPNTAYLEEFIHFGMLSHPKPERVLIVGGGAGGAIGEILKHPVKSLDYTELDPLLIQMVKDFPTPLTQKELADSRLRINFMDGIRFIKTTEDSYDVIFINAPLPSTLGLNRFYTEEFFSSVKRILNTPGILVLNLPGSLSYLGEELRKLNGSILSTLKGQFPFVKVIPGDSNLYLASEEEFEISPKVLVNGLKDRNISTVLLNPLYIEYRLHPRWSVWFRESLKETLKVKPNRDLSPTGLFYGVSYLNALFSPETQGLFKGLDGLRLKMLLAPLFILGLAGIALQRHTTTWRKLAIPFSIASTGFLGMTFDLVLIFCYQAFFGFVYHHIALLVTSFMAGLTLGGWLMTHRLSRLKRDMLCFLKIEIMAILFSLAVPILLINLGSMYSMWFAPIFFLLSALSGLIVGLEFPLANKIYGTGKTAQTAGILYSMDLLGAWMGALVVSIALLPLLGLLKTCLFLACLKLLSLALILTSKLT
ncbi:MAG TPA: spermine synthase [Syntrophaceae bacterium]|nr:spermine synthase [Syntrophaceae bacterium]